MNERQRIAFENPCRRLEDTINPAFQQRIGDFSTLLTVSQADESERPVWHASIALRRSPDKPPLTREEMTDLQREAFRIAGEMLDGVGVGDIQAEPGGSALHFYVELSAVEVAALKWRK